jgi:3-oxoacyl-(acyl-carrier-protein) synthase III
MKIGISAISHVLPLRNFSSQEIEMRVNSSGGYTITQGTIESITGIKNRFISDQNVYNSTLAIQAARRLFLEHSIAPHDIDLLIFASAGQDILEPATAHIVQSEIKTSCPVIDVTNACNSFLNALEIACAFIQNQKYKEILIVTGEVPSKSAKYFLEDRKDFKMSFPGFAFGDAGTAVLVNKASEFCTVLSSSFFADSSDWDVAMLPGGGSRFLDSPNTMFFNGDGARLAEPFFEFLPKLFQKFLEQNNLHRSEIKHFFMHQVSLPYLHKVLETLQINKDSVEVSIVDYGNIAAATIPFCMSMRKEKKKINSGEYGLCIGLAGGISIGFTLVQF